MRHSDAVFACYRWPSCDGGYAPGFDGAVGVAFSHRLAALGEMILVGGLATSPPPPPDQPDLFRVTAAAFILILLQAASGAPSSSPRWTFRVRWPTPV